MIMDSDTVKTVASFLMGGMIPFPHRKMHAFGSGVTRRQGRHTGK
jgi:hypothetical protein